MFEQAATRQFNQFSQELQLSGESIGGRLNWVAGAFYFEESPSEQRTINLRGIGRFATQERFTYDQKTKSYAVFGQGTLAITDRLSATLGGRYSKDEKTLDLSEPSRFPGVALTGKAEFDSFTPRADLQYKWTDDIMTYVSYAKGFKGGGINDRIIGVPGGGLTFLPFEDETNTTYEVGFRSDLFDRRVRLNATYFHTVYKDLQQALITGDPAIPNRTLVLTENIGQAKVDGIEADLIARVFGNLTINASFGWMDARITRVDPGTVGGFFVGNRLGSSPEYSYTIGAEYNLPLAKGDGLRLRADWAWTDAYLFATSVDSDVTNPAHGLLSASATYEAAGNWSVGVFGTNLTDKYYLQNGLDLTFPYGFVQTEPARPREIGVRLKARF